jgi:hypothetical protein
MERQNSIMKKEKLQSEGRNIYLPEHSLLTEKVIEQLDELFQSVEPSRLRRSLYEMFFSHLMHADIHHRDLKEIAEDFYFLFEFLEVAEEEM